MPVVSKKQFKFMKMLENNPERAKEVGMSTEKAAEFTEGVDYKKLPKKKGHSFSKLKGYMKRDK